MGLSHTAHASVMQEGCMKSIEAAASFVSCLAPQAQVDILCEVVPHESI